MWTPPSKILKLTIETSIACIAENMHESPQEIGFSREKACHRHTSGYHKNLLLPIKCDKETMVTALVRDFQGQLRDKSSSANP